MPRWYLIQSKLSCEAIAQANLERQGFSVYFPRLIKPTRRRARLLEQVVPLFPRYLFLHLHEDTQSLGSVRSTVGVIDAVRFGNKPAVVPDQVIEDLRLRADPETGLHRFKSNPLEPGTLVRITSGPFDGLEGIFEREVDTERVILLLNLLGQETRVRLPVDVVEAARKAA